MKCFERKILLWPLFSTGLILAGCNASNGIAATDATKPEVVVAEPRTEIVMYKSEGCECCGKWAEHMHTAGFVVIENKLGDVDAIKSQHGIPGNLSSCHTAIVDGYVIEGHVPAADVVRLLKERPKVVGLTAPGMPMESPGMQEPGQMPKSYDVFVFDADGKSRVFTRYYADGKFREFEH